MTKIKELVDYLHSVAPNHFQESYDNSGLLVGDPEKEITGVLTCLDSTEEIIEEAMQQNCNVVVAHHPIVFRGLKRFVGQNYVERVVIKAIRNDVAIIAVHTNLDNVIENGVNQKIAQKLQLENLRPLSPKADLTYDGGPVGSGIIGEVSSPVDELTFLQFVKSQMGGHTIKHTQLLGKKVQTVAICGGAGGFLLGDAIGAEADVFITSDYKYHEFFDADNQIVIADIGHYESEQYTIELLYDLIRKKFSNFAVRYTELSTNPVKYL